MIAPFGGVAGIRCEHKELQYIRHPRVGLNHEDARHVAALLQVLRQMSGDRVLIKRQQESLVALNPDQNGRIATAERQIVCFADPQAIQRK